MYLNIVSPNNCEYSYFLYTVAAFIKVDKWATNTAIYGDIDGGFPLVVFDSEMENAVVLSPSSDFMSANQATFMNDKTGEKTLTFGPLSSITEVCKSMLDSHRFIENSSEKSLKGIHVYIYNLLLASGKNTS